jgi:hypothetical protein
MVSSPDRIQKFLNLKKIASFSEILEKSQKSSKGLFLGNFGTHRLPTSIFVKVGSVGRDGMNFVRGNRVSFVGVDT